MRCETLTLSSKSGAEEANEGQTFGRRNVPGTRARLRGAILSSKEKSAFHEPGRHIVRQLRPISA